MLSNRITRLKKFSKNIEDYQKIFASRDGSFWYLSKNREAENLRNKLNKTYIELKALIDEAGHENSSLLIYRYQIPVFDTAFSSTGEVRDISKCLKRAQDVVQQVIGYWGDKREIINSTIEEILLINTQEIKKILQEKDHKLLEMINELEDLLKIKPINNNQILLACRNIIVKFSNIGKITPEVKREIKDKRKKMGEKNYATTYLKSLGMKEKELEIVSILYSLGSKGKDTENLKGDEYKIVLTLLAAFLESYRKVLRV